MSCKDSTTNANSQINHAGGVSVTSLDDLRTILQDAVKRFDSTDLNEVLRETVARMNWETYREEIEDSVNSTIRSIKKKPAGNLDADIEKMDEVFTEFVDLYPDVIYSGDISPDTMSRYHNAVDAIRSDEKTAKQELMAVFERWFVDNNNVLIMD